MITGGIAVARLIFVLRHADFYAGTPLAVLDLRDGGFDSLAGFLTAFVIGAELTRRTGLPCKALSAATLLGCAMFIGGTSLNQALFPPAAPVTRRGGFACVTSVNCRAQRWKKKLNFWKSFRKLFP
jgi:prolipoprotein diacylglyceryltransferase